MLRRALGLALLVLLSGCLVEPDSSVVQDPGTNGGNPNDAALPADGLVLGRLYLHHDGTRMWMDNQPSGEATDALPLPGLTAAGEGATYTFPLEPTASRDVVTSGLAMVALATSSTFGVMGGAPVFEARFLVDGQVVGSAAGGREIAVPVPALIPAGSSVALEVCYCGSLTDLSGAVFEPGASLLDVPGPGQAACGADALTPGATSVRRQGNQWIASRTDSASGSAPVRYDTLALTTANGGIAVDREGSGFRFTAVLHAGGATAEQAQARLDQLCVRFDLGGDSLTARLVSLDSSNSPWNSRGADFTLGTEAAGADRVELRASNGGLQLSGLDVATLEAGTSNDQVVVRGDVRDAQVSTSNDAIDLAGAFGDLDASTSNGAIQLDARPWGDGGWTWDLQTSNDAIRAQVVTGETIGYDVAGRTSNDDVTLDLADAQPVGTQRETSKHVRSNGYDGRAQRVALSMASSNDGITLSS